MCVRLRAIFLSRFSNRGGRGVLAVIHLPPVMMFLPLTRGQQPIFVSLSSQVLIYSCVILTRTLSLFVAPSLAPTACHDLGQFARTYAAFILRS